MGYMGLSSVYDSDNAADDFAGVIQSMADEMEKCLKVKTNEYNTDGIINVALMFEQPLLKAVPTYVRQDYFGDISKKVIRGLEKKIMILTKLDKKYKKDRNIMFHLSSFKRLLRSAKNYVKE